MRPVPRGVVVLTALVGAGGALVASATPWATGEVPTVIATSEVSVTGSEAAPLVPALALVCLAAGAAVALGRRWAAALAGVVLVVAGAALVATSLQVALEPRPAVLDAAAQVSGVRELAGEPSVTLAPYVGAVLGAVPLAAGIGALVSLRRWRPVGRRFQTPAATEPARPAATSQRDQAMDDWDALGRGEDPTDPR